MAKDSVVDNIHEINDLLMNIQVAKNTKIVTTISISISLILFEGSLGSKARGTTTQPLHQSCTASREDQCSASMFPPYVVPLLVGAHWQEYRQDRMKVCAEFVRSARHRATMSRAVDRVMRLLYVQGFFLFACFD